MLWTFRVSDRFGDSGLTGIISVEVEGDAARIVDFVMSCRVMGRKVEEAMLHVAIAFARARLPGRSVVAEFIPTDRNRPCLEFLRRSGFEEKAEHSFWWSLDRDYPWPSLLELVAIESTDVARVA
jgi:FkbH-like protein